MSLTFSQMLPLGAKAPNFTLQDVISDAFISIDSGIKYSGTLIMFICNHCPYVKHINEEIAKIGNDYVTKSIRIIAISSNDADSFPDDSPIALKEQADKFGFNFPYLYDEKQEVAKAYKAACTPDFFLFDSKLDLVYRGQLDDSRYKNDIPVTGSDLRSALDNVILGKEISKEQKPSSGCNIKWKEGVNPF